MLVTIAGLCYHAVVLLGIGAKMAVCLGSAEALDALARLAETFGAG